MLGSKVIPRLLGPPERSFFLFGPRGTGKSTWVRQALADAPRIDLLDQGLYISLLADPSRFAGELRARPEGSWVVVDEVQRIPSLLNDVHRFIEDRGLRFALCGSSARKLRQAGVNLLAGRALRRTLYPFVPEELGTAFDLDRVLASGSLPLVWSSGADRETLEAYVQTYLREEIQAEAVVRNLPGFVRFLPVAALFHGQTLSVSALARDAAVARTTVDGYLEILEDTLMAFRLPAFEARLRVRERRHPKLYWIDPGIVRAVKRTLGPVAPEERGALFEGWVATLLRAYQAYRHTHEEAFYWAPADARHTEVDFLLRAGSDFVAIEAKAGTRFDDADARGLRAIAGLAGLRRRIVVYRGDRRLTTADGIEVWPALDFAELLARCELF